MTAHWGIPDPAAVTRYEDEIQRAFREAFVALDRRSDCFSACRCKRWTGLAIQKGD